MYEYIIVGIMGIMVNGVCNGYKGVCNGYNGECNGYIYIYWS